MGTPNSGQLQFTFGLLNVGVLPSEGAVLYADEVTASGCGMLCTMPSRTPDFSALTVRELEVLRLLGRGESNRLMARWLGISERTAKAHIARVVEKVGAADRVQAIFFANRFHHLICDMPECGPQGLPKGQ